MFSSKKGAKRSDRRSHNPDREAILTEDSPWPVKEAYKALRTNIIFSLPGKDGKVIAMTSSGRGEGKSTNTINTAISFGQLKKKVIVLDCDMRLPTVAAKLSMRGVPGLSDYLAGQAELSTIVRRSRIAPIDVIPAGNIPPDPTLLLQSKQLGTLILGLRKVYDYIFIDLPPVTSVTDAALFASYADGYLLLIRHQNTEFDAVDDMLEQLKLANAHIIGFVYAGAEVEGKKYYRHYYYKKES
ncbi:MAG: CpsD/CapB family tyrosine-protein kinase [[Clostridium] aminophilum]|uniref:CpsD/CapB family tyrosine-protein kinase n=1 Tax=[Clostridium] aminophilum TaxID=1526 RepID=UPI0026EEC5C5|nr:CpsD/CapB family tyrosine-protein kinase [[Clostridium] aminophilum]MDD6195379.1 CpsD/CapB family tyrosine-protein kinase [[Clostridium] aminophilum]